MAKEMLMCAFHMNCVAHQSQGLWRHPRDTSQQFNSMAYWQQLAKTLERGLFDGIFLADVSGVYDVYAGSPDAALRTAMQIPTNDPFTVVPVMASVTQNLCFGVTGSIPYEPPYSFARKISSLDHLTDGRMGWNIVTGYLDSAAKGIGQDKKKAHDTRYDIAHEYMQVVYGLWQSSWDDDAVIRDREKGIFTDPEKVRPVKHDGEYFKLNAIHLCEPSPQRTPVLFQAGTSPKGQAFAGEHAECVFIGGNSPQQHSKSVESLRAQAVANGRKAEDLKIFGAITVIVGQTDAQALGKLADYRQYGSHEGALALLSGWMGTDLSTLELDAKITEAKSDAIQFALAGNETATVRQWASGLAVGGAGPVISGSPESVANQLNDWFIASGLDGFNLAYTVMPECVDDFVDLVIPQLQEMGVFKTRYRQGSFREKLFGRSARLTAPHVGSTYTR